MLKIDSVTWKQPEAHTGLDGMTCVEFYGHWESKAGSWCILNGMNNKHVLINFCSFCGTDLRYEKPALP